MHSFDACCDISTSSSCYIMIPTTPLATLIFFLAQYTMDPRCIVGVICYYCMHTYEIVTKLLPHWYICRHLLPSTWQQTYIHLKQIHCKYQYFRLIHDWDNHPRNAKNIKNDTKISPHPMIPTLAPGAGLVCKFK